MTETLLSTSEILLYGEKVDDMTFKDPTKKDKDGKDVIDSGTKKPVLLRPVRYFIRVLGFGYEGGYYAMDAPIIMLLEGDGRVPGDDTPKKVRNAFPGHIKEWICEKHDRTARLDELTGTLEDILLEVELGGGGGGRVSGGRVSGGRVSGGRVSGGRVSGGRVSGGKDD
jgi:hypothetical protein